ncbi:MAG: hypothetical protein ACREFL_15385 [Stellaceae bacterium]
MTNSAAVDSSRRLWHVNCCFSEEFAKENAFLRATERGGNRMVKNESAAHSMISWYRPCRSRGTRLRALAISASVGFCLAVSCSAQAGEKLAALECSSFCQPMNTRQLDTLRAEGASNPQSSASTQLSVILWDENRRLVAPRGASGAVTSPTTTPLTIAPPTSGSAPVPVLVH